MSLVLKHNKQQQDHQGKAGVFELVASAEVDIAVELFGVTDCLDAIR